MTSKACKRALKRPIKGNGVFKGQMLAEVWNALLPVMTRIFEGEELCNDEYMSLYSLVYDFCSCGDNPNPKFGRFSGPQNVSIWELALYKRIETFIMKKIQVLESLLVGLNIRDENQIFQYYIRYANGYFNGTRQLNGICRQLNNHMMKMVNSSEFHHIEHIAYMCWKRGIFNKLGKSVTKSTLGLIQKERDGEIIQSENINTVIASLIKIGYNPTEVNNIKERMKSPEVMAISRIDQEKLYKNRFETMELSIYKTLFEATFSSNTSSWFETKMKDILLTPVSSIDYVTEIFRILREELARVKKYCHPSTANSVLAIIVGIAISSKREKFFAAIPEIFESYRLKKGYQHKKISDLLRDIDQLCSVNVKDKEVFLEKLKTQVCIEIDDRLKKDCITKIQKIKPHLYVRAFQNTYDSFVTLMKEASLSEVYKTTLQIAMVNALAKNVVTRAKKVSDFSERTFALRLHCKLTRSNKQHHDEVEKACCSLMNLFPLLPNQISFEHRYRNYLMLRIAEKTSVSNELETKLINQMQVFSGFEYTAKLSKLLKEGTVSSTKLLQNFKQSQFWDGQVSFNFGITVLPDYFCPWSSADENQSFIIPLELSPAYWSFQNFYVAVRPKQKLQWLHSRSIGELKTAYLQKKYILACSVYQMAVILLFNAVDSRSFEDIVTQTGLKKEDANKVVLQLVGTQLLLLERKDASNSPSILNNEDVVKLNVGFTSKKVRVAVNAAVKIEQKQKDDEKANKDAGQDMSFSIQAKIVRVMKASQKMNPSALVSEVIADKSGKYKTVPESIIQALIETLIEKKYIEILENGSYQYIP